MSEFYKQDPRQPVPNPAEVAEATRRLEDGFSRVKTAEDARRLLEEAESARDRFRNILETTAADVAQASPKEQVALDEAIAEASRVAQELEPATVRGRTLLRQELLKRLRPLEAVDTALYLQINGLPHPPAVDKWASRYSYMMTGGWAWALVPLGFACLPRHRRHALLALAAVLPPLWLATSTVEYPIKRFFRRRRPFTDIVRAIVVGRRVGSFSFPSGHSAAAFAGAVLLHRYFPRQSPAFYTAAVMVAFSRIYLGAHYPGDVATGSLAGATLARTYHALWIRVGHGLLKRLR